MIREGQIVLFAFPQTDQGAGRLRPALVLRSLPGSHKDWLICMISTRLYQQVPELDEVVREDAPDFLLTGLKTTSLIRVARIAIVAADLLHGTVGNLAADRLERIRSRLGRWISGGPAGESTAREAEAEPGDPTPPIPGE
jgi:mRNA interferase MazF